MNCKSCGAPIKWIQNPNGKSVPLDAKPKMVYVHDKEKDRWDLRSGYETHFATCPNASAHRKPTGEDGDE